MRLSRLSGQRERSTISRLIGVKSGPRARSLGGRTERHSQIHNRQHIYWTGEDKRKGLLMTNTTTPQANSTNNTPCDHHTVDTYFYRFHFPLHLAIDSATPRPAFRSSVILSSVFFPSWPARAISHNLSSDHERGKSRAPSSSAKIRSPGLIRSHSLRMGNRACPLGDLS
jgi:hypothetical protein